LRSLTSLLPARRWGVGRMPPSDELASARQRIRQRIDADLDDAKIAELIEAALAVEKRVWVDLKCRGCGKGQRELVSVSDPVTASRVLETLLNQGEGRPGEAKSDGAEPIVICRTVYLTAGPGEDADELNREEREKWPLPEGVPDDVLEHLEARDGAAASTVHGDRSTTTRGTD